MMFAAGVMVGAACGVGIMCIISHKREQEHEMIERAVERQRMKGAHNHIE